MIPETTYNEYVKHPPLKTIKQVEKRTDELKEHIICLEADAEEEFFERIGTLEGKMELFEKTLKKHRLL